MDAETSEPSEKPFVEARIVPDEVIKSDAFAGGGHKRTARSLASTIKEFSEKDAAIGLEGKYGAGKSVVTAITQDILESDEQAELDYRVFTYDLWSHQSESFRRGYLEELLSWAGPDAEDLLEPKVVDSFRDDIRDRTIEITTENTQNFHWFAYVLLVAAPMLPLVIAWASPIAWGEDARNILFNLFGQLPFGLNSGILAQLSLVLLYVLYLVAIGRAFFKPSSNTDLKYADAKSEKSASPAKLRNALGEATQPFKTDKAQTEKQTQVIREEDPSTLEFQKLFRRIVQAIQKRDRTPKPVRIILVFDNIDRLPTSRIAQVWGEMRSIFAATLHRKLAPHGTVTAIVPFDQDLIDEAFAREVLTKSTRDEGSTSAGRELVSKTFAATLRVAPPIGFDSRAFFLEKLEFATKGQLSADEKWTIHRLFDLSTLRLRTPPSPRQIIAFINKIVVLWNERQGDIPPESLALYAIAADRISEDPAIIFNEAGLSNGADLVSVAAQSDWEIHLAAIYYNVGVDHVLPILMHRDIEATFIEGKADSIRELSERNHFDEALLAFAREYESRFQPADLQTYARILRALALVQPESPSVREAWRILNRLDAYSPNLNTVRAETLTSLGNRMTHAEASQVSREIELWTAFLFTQQFSEANLRDNLVPALDDVYAMLPTELQDEWKECIQESTASLEPDAAVALVIALNAANNLDASLVAAPTAGFDAQIVNVLTQNPKDAEPIIRAKPQWLSKKIRADICTQVFQTLDAQLGKIDAAEVFAPVWACFERDVSILETSGESRQKGNLVVLFKQALDSGNDELAARLYLFECLGSNKLNAPQYPNRDVEGIGSVHDAVSYYNERINDATKVPDDFIKEVASALAQDKKGRPFRSLAIQASTTSVYHFAFKEAVRSGSFTSPGWDEAINTYDQFRTILGEELFGGWLDSITSSIGLPQFNYPVQAQVKLLNDIEVLQVESLFEHADAQSKRFYEFTEEEWLATLNNENELLPLLENRLLSDLSRLSGLASSARLALRKHIAAALEGEVNWIRGDIYDPLFRALTDSSQTALLKNVAEDVSKEVSDTSSVIEFAQIAPEVFWKLPIHDAADEFMQNFVCPQLGSDLEFLVDFVERRPDEAERISKAIHSETTNLVRDDLSAAHTAADEQRRDQIKVIAKAFGIEFDDQLPAKPEK